MAYQGVGRAKNRVKHPTATHWHVPSRKIPHLPTRLWAWEGRKALEGMPSHSSPTVQCADQSQQQARQRGGAARQRQGQRGRQGRLGCRERQRRLVRAHGRQGQQKAWPSQPVPLLPDARATLLNQHQVGGVSHSPNGLSARKGLVPTEGRPTRRKRVVRGPHMEGDPKPQTPTPTPHPPECRFPWGRTPGCHVGLHGRMPGMDGHCASVLMLGSLSVEQTGAKGQGHMGVGVRPEGHRRGPCSVRCPVPV